MRSKTAKATHKKRKPCTRRRERHVLSAFARRLSTKKLYDLMGALRGPDCPEENASFALKNAITGRVRYILFGKRPSDVVATWVGYAIDPAGLDQHAETFRRTTIERVWRPTHYLTHLRVAVEASTGHPIWDGKEPEIIRALQS